MGVVNADIAALLQAKKNMQTAINSIETTKASMLRKYQDMGNGWNDSKYRELGDIVRECTKTLQDVITVFTRGERAVGLLAQSLQTYEDTNLVNSVSNTPLTHRRTPEEQAAHWKNVLNNTNTLISTYRTELVSRGVFNGAMLTKFLAAEKQKMLTYESEQLRAENGQRPPLSSSEEYHYVITGVNSPYNYTYLANEFRNFCIKDINSWVGNINPNPHNDPRRKVNCGKCAAAVFQRLNGNSTASAGLGTYSIQEMNRITGRTQTQMTPQQIEQYLRSQGAGSHVVVGVDRASGAGHWFNAFFDGQDVHTIEGQGGCMNGWPPNYGNVIYWDASI